MAKLLSMLLTYGLCLTSETAWGQTKNPVANKTATSKSSSSDTENKIVCYFLPVPTYKDGGGEGLMQFIAANTHYPAGHQESGRVYISFVVTKAGKVTDVHVQKGLGKPFDKKEAVRVVSMLGDFTPCLEEGKPRSVSFMVPIFFNPNKESH